MDTLYISVAPGLSPAFGEAKQSRRSHTAGPPQKSTPLSHSGVSTTHKAFQVKHNHLTKERSMLQANPHHQKLGRATSLQAAVGLIHLIAETNCLKSHMSDPTASLSGNS